MKRLTLLLALVSLIAGSLQAAVLTPGLAYFRPGLDVTPETGSAVLDLRYVKDEAAAAPLLAAVEPGSTNTHRVVLVLLSPETPAGLRHQITGRPHWLTVGRAAPGLKTDIVVTTSADAERRAFDALVAGTAPEKLIAENANKPRYDESTLVREHTGETDPVKDAEPATPAATPADPAAVPAAVPATPAAPVLFDAVLQRAVQIYRGLIVLKKI